MTVVTADTRRTSTTPNATMTTLASPTLGGAASSLWLVEMHADAEGPAHAFDAEVVWAVTAGAATLTLGERRLDLGPGDTVVLPADVLRRFVAGPAGFTAIATTSGPGHVVRDDGTAAGVPPWVA